MFPRLFTAFTVFSLIQSVALCQNDTKNIVVERAASQKWALLIGVDDYIHAGKLKYCGSDVSALRQRLVGLGFPEAQTFLLHDGAEQRKNAPFKSNIESVMELLLGKLDAEGKSLARQGLVSRGDLVVVAFSGHGMHLDGTSYFCPVDAKLDRADSLLSLEKLYRLLALSPAGVKLMLVDACRNDPRPDGTKGLKATAGSMKLAESLDKPPQGILVLSSCAPGQVSVEDSNLGHGVFMNYLLDGLSGNADQMEGNRNERVSLLELYRFASTKTKTHVAQQRRILQTPELSGKIIGDFEFGRIAAEPKPGDSITNRTGMKLAFVPAGEFLMGSSANEEDRDDDEQQHQVRISKPFYLGTTEVTQGQWQSVMGTTPWEGKSYSKENADHAASYVSWEGAVEFCKRLSAKEGVTYRLPTEAEWEYACRGGTTTAYHFGDDASRLGDYAWFEENADNVGEKYARAVGRKRPNAFGLYDMHGNVYEWCSDWYDAAYYANSPISDPTGPTSGSGRVSRGGCWSGNARGCRSAYRVRNRPSLQDYYLGFRVAQSPSGQ